MTEPASLLVGPPLGHGLAGFGTDGIRGRVGSLITPALALQVGYWAGQVLPPERPVLIGMDSRSSSPMLAAAAMTLSSLSVIANSLRLRR